MSEKKPMPKCPYCGWEMQHHFDYPMKYCDVQFYCKHCNAMSPSARGCQTSTESVEKALEEAYEKAMKRYEEPNRVLTLEELQTYIGYAWYEGDHKWYHSSFDYPVWIENGKYNYEGDLYDIPDVEGRFWLRKPTEDEREAAKWLPEEKKNKKDGEDDE